jgi:hypothetical protein
MKNSITTTDGGNAKNADDNAPRPADQGAAHPPDAGKPHTPTATNPAAIVSSISEAVAKELAIFEEARVSQTVESFEGGRKALELIPVRRPQKTTWFKAHPDQTFWYRAFLLEDERTGDFYFLSRPVWESLVELGEKAISRKLLIPLMSRNNVLTVWPVSLGADGTLGTWAESALTAAVTARTEWVRIMSNREMGGYEIRTRPSDGVEPQWPDISVVELLRIAFKGRVVTGMDHPIIRDLRGETVSRSADDRLNALLGGGEG